MGRLYPIKDHLLPQISPNVSLLPGSDSDPLLHFLAGLDLLAKYPTALYLPGHRHPFSYGAKRIEDLKLHHEERLAEWLSWIQAKPCSAYEICTRAFGTIEKLTIHQFRFALGETLAHLRELERRGKLTPVETHNQVMWHSLVS